MLYIQTGILVFVVLVVIPALIGVAGLLRMIIVVLRLCVLET